MIYSASEWGRPGQENPEEDLGMGPRTSFKLLYSAHYSVVSVQYLYYYLSRTKQSRFFHKVTGLYWLNVLAF